MNLCRMNGSVSVRWMGPEKMGLRKKPIVDNRYGEKKMSKGFRLCVTYLEVLRFGRRCRMEPRRR